MIETARLILRPWRDSDMLPFAEQNADPVVMRLLGGVLSREASDAYAARAEAHLAAHGFCKWAVEAPGVAPFVGAVGLSYVRFEASFTPAVEVAWRLHRAFWGRGYATEAARAAIDDGFQRVGLQAIVAMTGAGQPCLAPGHAAPWHDAVHRVRSSELRSGPSAVPARAVPAAVMPRLTQRRSRSARGRPPTHGPEAGLIRPTLHPRWLPVHHFGKGGRCP